MPRRQIAAGLMGLLILGGTGWAQDAPFPKDVVNWVPDPPEAVFTGTGRDTWDRMIRERGWILVEKNVYHLFYTGYNDDRSPTHFLGHATSPDGIHWTRDPENPIHDASWVEDMCVLKHQDQYYMFAEGKDDIAHGLTSTDLRHWTERGPLDIRRTSGEPISPGPRGTPFVLIDQGVWNLLYERGDRGVWLARSPDGKVWTNVRDDPVLRMGPEAYDRAAVAVNQVVQRDGVFYAFYHANASRPWKDWTSCMARSTDLVHWEKYPGNPVIDHNWSSPILVEGPGGTHLYTMHPEVRRFSNPQPDAGKGVSPRSSGKSRESGRE